MVADHVTKRLSGGGMPPTDPVYIRSINDSSTKLYAPENARDQVAFRFSLVLDWLIGWHRFLD